MEKTRDLSCGLKPLFHYSYPEELVALKPRPHFKALFVDLKKNNPTLLHDKKELFSHFQKGDILAFNQTCVLPRKLVSLEGLDVLFIAPVAKRKWSVLYPAKKTSTLHFSLGSKTLKAQLIKRALPQVLELDDEVTEEDFKPGARWPFLLT